MQSTDKSYPQEGLAGEIIIVNTDNINKILIIKIIF